MKWDKASHICQLFALRFWGNYVKEKVLWLDDYQFICFIFFGGLLKAQAILTATI